MQLTSSKNPVLQSIRRAAQAGRPTEDGLIVAEGPHLLEEATGSPWRIEQVFATSAARERYGRLLSRVDAEIIEVSPRAFQATTQTETSQEVLALLRPRTWKFDELVGQRALLLVLDGVQDPGNAGTVVRSAEAFGATGVILLKGSVGVANGKFLRATAGSIYRMPHLEGWAGGELLARAREEGIAIFALHPSGGAQVEQADLRQPCALITGSEGRGVGPELAGKVQQISIRTARVESLNAAVACSIALYEARRQRGA